VVLGDLQRLRSAGITNLNIDLIAGLAGQSFATWQESVSVLLETGVPHASIYMLEVDDDSRLGRELIAGGLRYHAELVPNDETITRMYETAIEGLTAAGLLQYEISNFARRGFKSRHNLRYWQRRPYLGLGLDASSMLRATPRSCESSQPGYVLRSTTTDELKTYLDVSQSPETAWLSPDRQHEEAWFLGLRLNEGISLSALRKEFGNQMVAHALDKVEQLIERGLVTSDAETVRLTPQGRLLSNDVFQEFLAVPSLHA
jgi:oxygen-independent coproporphyrinogen-3 oxidase